MWSHSCLDTIHIDMWAQMLTKLEDIADKGELDLFSPQKDGDYLSPLKASIRIAKSLCVMQENDTLKKL